MPFKSICIPESFNTNILHQRFDYKITYVNSQLEKTNSEVILYSKTDLKKYVSKIYILIELLRIVLNL